MQQHETAEASPPPPEGMWFALLLDGEGGAKELDWDGVQRWTPEQGGLWLWLDPRHARAQAWLRDASGVSDLVREELLKSDLRPTFRPIGEHGFLLAVVSPTDPVARAGQVDLGTLRAWVEPTRAINVAEHGPTMGQPLALLRQGRGPHSVAALGVLHLVTHVTQLAQQTGELEHTIADLEFAVHDRQDYPEAIREGQARVARLLRQVAPLKVVTSRALLLPQDNWLLQDTRESWRFSAEKVRNLDQLLRILQERSLTLHAYVSENLALRMNSILLVLTVVSMVTLPVTLIAALFNINIGIPGRSLFGLDSPVAFAITVGSMLLLAGLMYALLRRQRLFQLQVEGSRVEHAVDTAAPP